MGPPWTLPCEGRRGAWGGGAQPLKGLSGSRLPRGKAEVNRFQARGSLGRSLATEAEGGERPLHQGGHQARGGGARAGRGRGRGGVGGRSSRPPPLASSRPLIAFACIHCRRPVPFTPAPTTPAGRATETCKRTFAVGPRVVSASSGGALLAERKGAYRSSSEPEVKKRWERFPRKTPSKRRARTRAAAVLPGSDLSNGSAGLGGSPFQ